MKNFTKSFAFALCLVLFSISVHAQVPNGVNYQAIARDVNGVALVNQKIALRFTISTAGTTNYQETTAVTSNALGLVTFVIGSGTPVTGTFAAIPWTGASKSLQVEMDPTGVGTTYPISTTQALESVPYSFISKYVQTVSNFPVDSLGNVKITGVAAGNVLVYNAGKWVNESQWQLNGTSLYYSAGNVGIGTTTPIAPLNVVSTATSGNTYPFYIDGATSSYTGMWIRNSSATGNSLYGYYANNSASSAYHFLSAAGVWTLYNGGNAISVGNTSIVSIPKLQVPTTPTTGYVLTSDATGNATWQAGNPKVAFSTYPIIAQTISAGINPITLAGESFDDGNNVVNGVFTAPVTGTYSFSVNLLGNGFTAGARWGVFFYVNGVQACGSYQVANNTDYTTLQMTNVLKLTAGQTVSLETYLTSGTGSLYESGQYTYFTGYQLY